MLKILNEVYTDENEDSNDKMKGKYTEKRNCCIHYGF